MRAWFLILVVAAAALEGAADVAFKQWANTDRAWLLWLGFGLYCAGAPFWAWSLRHEGLANAIVVFACLNVVFVATAGMLLFGEALGWRQWTGVVLALAAIGLVEGG